MCIIWMFVAASFHFAPQGAARRLTHHPGRPQIYLDKQGNLMLRVSWLYRQREVKAAGVKFRPEEVMYSRCDA